MKVLNPTIRPTKKQHLAWQALKDPGIRQIYFGGGAGGGKTWFGCEMMLTACYQYPGFRGYVARNELKRLLNSVYVTWRKVCAHHQIPADDWKFNGQSNYIEFVNGSRVDFLDVAYLPSDPLYERFGSLEYSQGWNEEASEINFAAIDVLKTRIGRHLNKELGIQPKMLSTCNPKKNWLYQMVYKPWKEGTLPADVAFVQSLYGDNPHTSKEYGDQLGSITDTALKQRLMYGNWEYEDDENSLINYNAITDLFTNTVDSSEEQFLIVDVARYGRDKTVLNYFKGLESYEIAVYEKQGLDVTADKIRLEAKVRQIPYSNILIDEDGVGGGIVDNLRGVRGFVANTTPVNNLKTSRPDNYQNLKTQCVYLLADYVNSHKVSVKNIEQKHRTALVQELEQLKSKDLDLDSKRKVVGKDVIKELIGRSPDISDTFVMRMYYELNPALHGYKEDSVELSKKYGIEERWETGEYGLN